MDKNKSWILKRKKNVLHGLKILKKKIWIWDGKCGTT